MEPSDSNLPEPIFDREIFGVTACVHAVWAEKPEFIRDVKDLFLDRSWGRGMTILLEANRLLLSNVETTSPNHFSPPDLTKLANNVNIWLDPDLQMSTDDTIATIQIVVDPTSDFAVQRLTQETEEVLIQMILFLAGLVSHCAHQSGTDPYTVLMRTLSKLPALPFE